MISNQNGQEIDYPHNVSVRGLKFFEGTQGNERELQVIPSLIIILATVK